MKEAWGWHVSDIGQDVHLRPVALLCFHRSVLLYAFSCSCNSFWYFFKNMVDIYFPYHSHSSTSLQFSTYSSHPFLLSTFPSFMPSFTLSCPLYASSNLFPVLPRSISASQRKLQGSIEILIALVSKTAFRAICGGSKAAPRQSVNFRNCNGNAVADGVEVEWRNWKKERGNVHMRTHEGEIRAASWHLHMHQLNSLQVIKASSWTTS